MESPLQLQQPLNLVVIWYSAKIFGVRMAPLLCINANQKEPKPQTTSTIQLLALRIRANAIKDELFRKYVYAIQQRSMPQLTDDQMTLFK